MSIQRISTSVSPLTQWKYDVFLSFRGDDTRKAFTDHLYSALEHQGIKTFRDDPELQKGKAISPELFAAIEESRYAIIVLSQNYGSSTWCLDELVRILKCMKIRETVLPIFYDVDPSDVRKQTGRFREAFANHEERFRDDQEKVKRWRSALTEVASFTAWNSKDWYESKLIKNIVEDIWKKLQPISFTYAENLVGMDSRLQPVFSLLGEGVDDIRFIGIWGMGGIGKTTMVRAVFERIACAYEFPFLLTEVRNSVEKGGLLDLQKQLLSGILTKEADISDLHEGATILERLLRYKKVLLILDDVNHSSHLKYLAGKQEWFGSGSRILITTRNEHLLIQHGVERRLKVKELNDNDSLHLFSWKVFKRDYPEEDFLDLSKSVISYAKGLPLVVEVLGSFLHGRDLAEWKSALRKLGRVCNMEIFDILKVSYNDLDSEEKQIFLDIACFFNGRSRYQVTEILTSCDVSAIIGIKVLMERSLLTLSNGRLWMHDLLREMGHEIVRLESSNEPGRRSRLWLLEDVKHVLTRNTGTEAIEGIFLDSTESGMEVDVTPKSFSMMNKLRFLKIKNGNLPKGLQYLPNSLRILDWTRYPSKSLPAHFHPQKLLELILCHSFIKHVRIGTEPLYNLKIVNLSHSLNLVDTPNFKGMPYLELLILEGCTGLYKVDPGIVVLERLSLLNLKDCKNLVHFANSVRGLKSLKVLILSGCSKLKRLPDDIRHLESLKELHVNGTVLRELPTSIGMLQKLSLLNMENCKHIVCLPSSVGGLKSLKCLNLSGCSKLGNLPHELGRVAGLRILDVSGSGIREVPSFIVLLTNLRELAFGGCKAESPKSWNMIFNPFQLLRKSSCIPSGLSLHCLSGLHSLTHLNLSDCNLVEEAVPSDFGCLASLTRLNLSGNQFVRLPECIGQLARLAYLYLDRCCKLQILPDLPSHVWVHASNCIALDTLANENGQCNSVVQGSFVNCFKMVENASCKSIALSLLARYLKFQRCGSSLHPFTRRATDLKLFDFVGPGTEIPQWYSHQSVESSILVELHPGWFTNKVMGFAFCVVFRLLKPLRHLVDLYCEMTVHGESSDYVGVYFGGKWGQPVSDHIWLSYLHHDEYEWQDIYYELELSFKLRRVCSKEFGIHEEGVEEEGTDEEAFEEEGTDEEAFEEEEGMSEEILRVSKCGVHLVYEEDAEELWETLLEQRNVGMH